MTIPLLATRLYIPTPRPNQVSRRHLVTRLNASLPQKLTLVSAPAGFGKTTLLGEWVRDFVHPVAWISLSKKENDLSRFLSYLVAAFQMIDGDIGKGIPKSLHSRKPPVAEHVLTTLLNDLDRHPDSFVLVLDDYHEIFDDQVHQAVNFVLDNQPRKMHMVIATRSDPPWPLARMRARGEMTELRARDMRFSPAETHVFINEAMGFDLKPKEIARLEARTEGWIAGLQMVALSIRSQEDPTGFIASFTGSNRFIFDYLVEEVLAHQTSEVRTFLIRTSILEFLTAPLCDFVLEWKESQRILTSLDQENLFIEPLDDERCWYRYHRLFADLLRNRLHAEQEGQLQLLHLRASKWHEVNSQIPEAVNHAFQAGDMGRVAKLVSNNALTMVYHGELGMLKGWLSALPGEVFQSRPLLCIAHAWMYTHQGHLDEAESWLECIDCAVDEQENSSDKLHILGHAAAIRGYRDAMMGDVVRGAEQAQMALETIHEGDLVARGFACTLLACSQRWVGDLDSSIKASEQAIAISEAAQDQEAVIDITNDLVVTLLLKGEFNKAMGHLDDILHLYGEPFQPGKKMTPATGQTCTLKASILWERNDLENALDYAELGVKLSKQWGQAHNLYTGYMHLARVHQTLGQSSESLTTIHEGKKIAQKISPWYLQRAETQEVQILLMQDELDKAALVVQGWGVKAVDPIEFKDFELYQALANFLFKRGRHLSSLEMLEDALVVSEQLLNIMEKSGANGEVINYLVFRAMIYLSLERVAEAFSAVSRALSLAESQGYIRTFIEQGLPMEGLLRKAMRDGVTPEYTYKLLHAMDTKVQEGDQKTLFSMPTLVEPLTPREIQVLRLLKTNLSIPEIADELVVTVSTIRTHVKGIYRKLDAHSRIEAVAKADDFGL